MTTDPNRRRVSEWWRRATHREWNEMAEAMGYHAAMLPAPSTPRAAWNFIRQAWLSFRYWLAERIYPE